MYEVARYPVGSKTSQYVVLGVYKNRLTQTEVTGRLRKLLQSVRRQGQLVLVLDVPVQANTLPVQRYVRFITRESACAARITKRMLTSLRCFWRRTRRTSPEETISSQHIVVVVKVLNGVLVELAVEPEVVQMTSGRVFQKGTKELHSLNLRKNNDVQSVVRGFRQLLFSSHYKNNLQIDNTIPANFYNLSRQISTNHQN